MEERLNIKALAAGGEEKPGWVNIKTFTASERNGRAFKFLGLYWGLALVSVLIPLAHFVLVPGFFFIGIFVAFYVRSAQSLVTGGETTCPFCQAQVQIVRMPLEWPLNDKCSACQRSFSIEKV